TRPDGPTTAASSNAKSPVPVATSSTVSPGRKPAWRAVYRRHATSRRKLSSRLRKSYVGATRRNKSWTYRSRSSRAASFSSATASRSEEHTSELQSRENLVCRLLLEKKK